MENDPGIEDRLNQLRGPNETDGDADYVIDQDVQSHEFSPMSDPTVRQYIIRSTAEGKDQLSGEFRITIAANQSTSVVHVPLYPPMQHVPEVEAFCENENVRIRVTDAQRFGIRLEMKTAQSSDAIDEIIQVQIVAVQTADD